jgi:hypothetical protein
MIDKRACIWLMGAALVVLTVGFLFGRAFIKPHFPGYTVHKVHAIAYLLIGAAVWIAPTKMVWFKRLGRLLVIIAINNFVDEFWGDPYSVHPVEYCLGAAALFSILPVRRWFKKYIPLKRGKWTSSKDFASR